MQTGGKGRGLFIRGCGWTCSLVIQALLARGLGGCLARAAAIPGMLVVEQRRIAAAEAPGAKFARGALPHLERPLSCNSFRVGSLLSRLFSFSCAVHPSFRVGGRDDSGCASVSKGRPACETALKLRPVDDRRWVPRRFEFAVPRRGKPSIAGPLKMIAY